MSTAIHQPLITFPEGYEDRGQFEAPERGYLSEVVVQLEDGSRYELSFYDTVRLGQDLADEVQAGRACFAEPHLVVLAEVSTENIRRAVHELWRDGYFQRLKPL